MRGMIEALGLTEAPKSDREKLAFIMRQTVAGKEKLALKGRLLAQFLPRIATKPTGAAAVKARSIHDMSIPPAKLKARVAAGKRAAEGSRRAGKAVKSSATRRAIAKGKKATKTLGKTRVGKLPGPLKGPGKKATPGLADSFARGGRPGPGLPDFPIKGLT